VKDGLLVLLGDTEGVTDLLCVPDPLGVPDFDGDTLGVTEGVPDFDGDIVDDNEEP